MKNKKVTMSEASTEFGMCTNQVIEYDGITVVGDTVQEAVQELVDCLEDRKV